MQDGSRSSFLTGEILVRFANELERLMNVYALAREAERATIDDGVIVMAKRSQRALVTSMTSSVASRRTRGTERKNVLTFPTKKASDLEE